MHVHICKWHTLTHIRPAARRPSQLAQLHDLLPALALAHTLNTDYHHCGRCLCALVHTRKHITYWLPTTLHGAEVC